MLLGAAEDQPVVKGTEMVVRDASIVALNGPVLITSPTPLQNPFRDCTIENILISAVFAYSAHVLTALSNSVGAQVDVVR